MIAAKDPAMNPQECASVVEVDQPTILRLADKGDLPGTCGSSRRRFQGPDKQSWSPPPSFSPRGLGLTPYPGVEHPEAIEADYQMKDGMLVLDMRAPLVGYALRRWAVDCTLKHGLDPKQHHLYLKNPQTLYGVESAALAPGYTVGRVDL